MGTYRHGNGRVQHRGLGGRFRHTTLRDFGLETFPCVCGALNPRGLDEGRPETCSRCGAVMVYERCTWSRVPDPRHTGGGFLDPVLFRQGAYQECGAPAIACELDSREGRCAEHAGVPRPGDGSSKKDPPGG